MNNSNTQGQINNGIQKLITVTVGSLLMRTMSLGVFLFSYFIYLFFNPETSLREKPGLLDSSLVQAAHVQDHRSPVSIACLPTLCWFPVYSQ